MAGHFKKRLEQQILEELTELVSLDVKDPAVLDLVFTGVELNSDLSVARIFYMPPATGDDEDTARGLERCTGFLRGTLGRRLRLQESPELRFKVDDSLDRANRLDEILETEDEAGPTGEGR